MKVKSLAGILLATVFLMAACGDYEENAPTYIPYVAHEDKTFFERFIYTHATSNELEFDTFIIQWDVGTFFLDDGTLWGLDNFTSLEHLEHLLGHEQRYSHAIIIADLMSEYLGITVTPEEIKDHLITFSWRDWVSNEQFEIAMEYLGVPTGMFNDNIIHAYMWAAQPPGIMAQIDASITMEEEHGAQAEFAYDNPQRIIVQMYRGLTDFANIHHGY
ncbi:MAG: hypothetical protein FWC76_04535 [Defluviitaleaceae bacterium]|nr:hypothetical protein [Defluviitaleaceae bacterium]